MDLATYMLLVRREDSDTSSQSADQLLWECCQMLGALSQTTHPADQCHLMGKILRHWVKLSEMYQFTPDEILFADLEAHSRPNKEGNV